MSSSDRFSLFISTLAGVIALLIGTGLSAVFGNFVVGFVVLAGLVLVVAILAVFRARSHAVAYRIDSDLRKPPMPDSHPERDRDAK